jgi:hypothetical protein
MTGDKVKEVADRYEKVIRRAVEIISEGRFSSEPGRGPVTVPWTQWSQANRASHLLFACAEMKRFIDGDRMEKACRWLGWIQGTFTALGVYTIDECGNHNRPDPPEDVDGQNEFNDGQAAGRLACKFFGSSA